MPTQGERHNSAGIDPVLSPGRKARQEDLHADTICEPPRFVHGSVLRPNNLPVEFVDRMDHGPRIAEVRGSSHCNLEITIVPLEMRPGMTVPIPCRHCEKTLIRFSVSEGGHSLACPRCGCATEVRVYNEGGALRIKTAKGAVRVKPTS